MKKKILKYIQGLFQISENEKASTLIFAFLVLLGLTVYGFITSTPHVSDSNTITGLLGMATVVSALNLGNTYINSKTDTTPSTEQSSTTTTTPQD